MRLDKFGCVVCEAEKSWYKSGSEEIQVWQTSGGAERSVLLQSLSPVVKGLKAVNQRRLYVPAGNRTQAKLTVSSMKKRIGEHDEGNQKD